MHEYDETCECWPCSREKVLRRFEEARREAKARAFKEAYGGGGAQGQYQYMDDPFPPKDEEYRVKDSKRRDQSRFRTVHPNAQQAPRFTGKFRREYSAALDVYNWQYQPWPGHEWVTYFTVTQEAIVRAPNMKWFGHQAVMNSQTALSEKRFYKVERVN